MQGSSNIISANLKENEKQGHDLGVECYNVSQVLVLDWNVNSKQRREERDRANIASVSQCWHCKHSTV